MSCYHAYGARRPQGSLGACNDENFWAPAVLMQGPRKIECTADVKWGCIMNNAAVIYARVSSIKQVREGNGLSSQIAICNEHCKKQGFEAVEIFQDDTTGGSGDRKGLNSLKQWLARNKAKNVVVVFDALSRLARDVRIYHEIKDAAIKAGARFSCPTFRFEDSPEGELSENIQISVDQFQRQQNAKQTKSRTKGRLINGYWCMKAPFGYRSDGKGKVMVPHETFAPIAKAALEGYASGHFQTHGEVRTFIEKHPDFRAQRKNPRVGNNFVKDLLSRSIYAGYYDYAPWGVPVTKGKHQPLISMQTHKKIQDRLDQRVTAPFRKDIAKDFPLRGFIVCADCGSPLTSYWAANRKKVRYPYYECHKKGCPSHRKAIPREKLEREFENYLRRLEPSADIVVAARAMLKDMWDGRRAHLATRRKSIKGDAKKIEMEIEGFLDRIVETTNPSIVSAYEKRVTHLQGQLAILEEEEANLDKKQPAFEDMFEHTVEILSTPCKIWQKTDLRWKRLVLKSVFAERLPYSRIKGLRTGKTTFAFNALSSPKGDNGFLVPPERLELPTL
ncbi:recombinase family protein [Tropicimonas omnivorans]|uniref:recombinase family protein n=1 Tax=Tropicimonas omnivorans TaxID=3075590 RepID=UPI003D77EBC7